MLRQATTRIKPAAPIRSSSIDSTDKPPTPTRSSSIDGAIAKILTRQEKIHVSSPLTRSATIDQVDAKTISVQASKPQIQEQTIAAKTEVAVEQTPTNIPLANSAAIDQVGLKEQTSVIETEVAVEQPPNKLTVDEGTPKRKMRPAKPLRPSLMYMKEEDKPTPIIHHKPPLSPPEGPPPPPPESESPFKIDSFTYEKIGHLNGEVSASKELTNGEFNVSKDLSADKNSAELQGQSLEDASNSVIQDGFVISLDAENRNSVIENEPVKNSVEKDENSNTLTNKNLKILDLSVPYTETNDSVIKDKITVESTNGFAITLETTK